MSFEGQVLFVEETRTHALLDCLLARRGEQHSKPMTFLVRFPMGRTSKDLAKDLLRSWADEGVIVSVTIADGRAGPEVAMATATARLVLEPEEAAKLT